MPANEVLMSRSVSPNCIKKGNNSFCLCRLERVCRCQVTVQKPWGHFEENVRGCQRTVSQRILHWYVTGSCVCASLSLCVFVSYFRSIILILCLTFKGMFPQLLQILQQQQKNSRVKWVTLSELPLLSTDNSKPQSPSKRLSMSRGIKQLFQSATKFVRLLQRLALHLSHLPYCALRL